MGWSVWLPEEALDPAYDPYLNRIALVEDAGTSTGYLVTYAQRVSAFRGFRRWRPCSQVVEDFMGWHVPHEGRADEVLGLEPEDLRRGRMGTSRLRWLEGEERTLWWGRYLREWGPEEPSGQVRQLGVDGDRFVLVIETGGHVHVSTSLDTGLPSLDSEHVVAAFHDDGEVLAVVPGAESLWLTLRPTGQQDLPGLQHLLATALGPVSLADQPRAYAATLHRQERRAAR
ncbi:hypothetical protein [Auraticoccus monumenti]|uniref:Uncharacterized protein n=1 Tax=Auraticoccus monumenti TaxID=675864 RepID=A0A1G6RLD0_9ACTN|nr:hypothetical protein [Auraticoccus monumenti]SDD05459.1 hypothetical protein SAMN04489747_0058 [Auraticoccus monumenti]